MKQLWLYALLVCSSLLVGCNNGDDGALDVPDGSAIEAQSLVVTPKTVSLPVGFTQAMQAKAQLTDGRVVDVTTSSAVSWSSSDTSVATIDASGEVSTLSVGTATITASGVNTDGTTLSDTATITVTSATATALTLTPKTQVLAKGLMQAYRADALMSDGSSIEVTAYSGLSWSSSDVSVATIDNQGVASALAVGTTTLTVRGTVGSKTLSDTATLTVSDATVDHVTVKPANASVAVGLEQAFEAEVVLSDGRTQTVTEQVNWRTSNPTTALVSNDAGSKGVAEGRAVSATPATISATLTVDGNDYTGNANLTVTDATVSTFIVTPAESTVIKGQTQALKAQVTLSDGQTFDVTSHSDVSWSTSDNAVVSIMENGVVKGESVGSATITATGTVAGADYQASATVSVTAATLSRIQVTPADETTPVGFSKPFKAMAIFSDESSLDITDSASLSWSSSDSTIATISDNGVAKGEGAGRVTITATDNSGSAPVMGTANLTVTEAVPTTLTVTPTSQTTPVGLTTPLMATVMFSDKSSQVITTEVDWSSSDNAIASVSNAKGSEGIARGEAAGTVTVTATGTLADGSTLQDSMQLTVTEAVVTVLQVTPTSASIPVGLTQSLEARAFFSDNTSQVVTDQVSWTSSDNAIVDVSTSGVASAIRAGSATITATGVANGESFTGTSTITVTEAEVASLAVTPTTDSVPVGLTQTFMAKVTMTDGVTTYDVTDNPAISWTSSDTAIATIIAGVATGVAPGTATLTASGSVNGIDFSANATLTVTDAVIRSIQVTPATDSIPVGLSRAFTAMALLSDELTSFPVTDDAAVSWTSSNPFVATVTTGLASGNGQATAISSGTTTITAQGTTPEGLVVSGSATLTVSDAIVTKLTVTPVDSSVAKGLTQQFIAKATLSDNLTTIDVTTDPSISWSTDGSGTVTVDANGLATGEAMGVGTVIASGTTPEGTSLSSQGTLTVTEAVVTGLQITPPTKSIAKGLTQQFTATALMSDGSSPTVTDNALLSWTTSNPEIASITSNQASGNGLASADGTATGDVTITASGTIDTKTFEGTATLTVTDATAVSLGITPTTASIADGLTQQYQAKLTLTDGSTEDVTATSSWRSGDTTIATIDARGLAKGESAGSASITVAGTYDGIDLTANASLSVTAAEVVSIDVTPDTPSIAAGRTQQMMAMATLTNGDTTDISAHANTSWTSDNDASATVDTSGLVTSTAPGSLVITASYAGPTPITGSETLTVTDAVLDSITVEPNPLEVMAGDTASLTATGLYSDGTTPDITSQVGWTGQDTGIATVEAGGLVTGVVEGSTTTTATLDDVNSSVITINVAANSFKFVCGGAVDDTDPTNATGNCLKVATDADGNWFTSTPSIAVMNALGYTADDSDANSGKTYAATYTNDDDDIYYGDGGEFAAFRQDGADVINPDEGDDANAGVGGQFDRWCQDLAAMEFAGKSTWRRPTHSELEAFFAANGGDVWLTLGWPGGPYWSSTLQTEYYRVVYSGEVPVTISLEPLNDYFASCVAAPPPPPAPPVCGAVVDDADKTNAAGNCLKVATDADGKWFTSTPSIAVMDALGYTIDDSDANFGKTYANTVVGSGAFGPDGGEFARFRQDGVTLISSPSDDTLDVFHGIGGQYSRWCRYLGEVGFAGKSYWRRPTRDELEGLYDTNGNMWDVRGWPTAAYYWSSTPISSSYYRLGLNNGNVVTYDPDLEAYASCVSAP